MRRKAVDDLKFWANFGLGAVFAVAVSLAYRIDRKASEERFADLAREFRTIVRDNTEALTKLTDALGLRSGTSR
jgi:hypothetical protein